VDAARAIDHNVLRVATLVALTSDDYAAVVANMAELGITGGAIYDAPIARAARKADVDRLLTFNPRDFKRVWPEGETVICEP